MKKTNFLFIKVISLLFFAAFVFYYSSAEAANLRWLTLIKSKKDSERRKGEIIVLEQRDAIIKGLLSVVDSPVEKNESFFSKTPRNTAILLLGKFRATEAIPSLVKWLVPKEGQDTTVWAGDINSPAGSALAKIGLPAVDSLIEVIKSEKPSALTEECAQVIFRILGTELAEAKLQNAIAAGKDEQKKNNIEKYLKRLKSNKQDS